MESLCKHVTIFGAGPAGLFCAYQLVKKGLKVSLYDHQGGVGKKFLVAGHGGLNLTHSEDLDAFSKRYGKDHLLFEDFLSQFSPQDLRDWCHELGVETFVGSSGRVFPVSMKSAEILFIWLDYLKKSPLFEIHLKHKLIDIDFENLKAKIQTIDQKEREISADAFVYALGGASWKKTGSDGSWTKIFQEHQIECIPFEPMNCGFEKKWSNYFKEKIDRYPLKNIGLSLNKQRVLGEMMLTPYGIEGTSVYALSREIREDLKKNNQATVSLDLCPHWSEEKVYEQLQIRKKKVSKSAYLNKAFKFSKQVNILLKEVLNAHQYDDDLILAKNIKALPICVDSIRPIDEAISTSGGVSWEEVDRHLQLRKYPHHFIIGEMLDFDAPTGGYLLQGAFSTAYVAAQKIIGT